jgi:hypothetical protein
MTREEKINKEWEAFRLRLYLLGYAKFSKALKKQIEPILASLEGTQQIVLINAMSTELITTLPIQQAFNEFISIVGDRSAKKTYQLFMRSLPNSANISVGFGSDIFKAQMQEYLNTIGGQHIKDITDTTRKLVSKAFTDGIEAGDTTRQLSKRIESYTLGSNGSGLEGRINVKARALMISKTETLMASEKAKDLQIDESVYLYEKKWVKGHPKEPRETHIQVSQNKPIDKDKPFIVGGVKMYYAGDSRGGAENVINCKCSTIYLPKEDAKGDLIKK